MRVLLIGGSGTYGALLRTVLGRRAEVVVSQRRLGPHFENYFDALHPLINPGWLTEFDTVVYAVGLPSIQSSEDAPEDSQRLNHLTPVLLNELCKSRQIQFIFLSTGAVLPFIGLSPAHAERLWLDRGIGATRYGLDKALAEHEILENQGTVVRLSKIALPIWRPLNSWVENLRSGHEVTAFCDHYVSPIDAGSASLA